MAVIVQKYGGASVSDLDMIKKVAKKVVKSRGSRNKLVTVVSAMAGETDRLGEIAKKVSRNPNLREYDNLLASGEQISSSLLALSIQSLGKKAVSLLGHQIPIMTDDAHTRATIDNIGREKIEKWLNSGHIVVVAGFQGIDQSGDITTFGRGGSDITAVAIAASLGAKFCELYKDVAGVFTAEPSIVSDAKMIPAISYDALLELTSMGAKIVHPRAVKLAKKYGIPLKIKSTFGDGKGTMVSDKIDKIEETKVIAITCDKRESKISIANIPNDPALEHSIFKAIANNKVWADMIVQSISKKGVTDITFTVSREESDKVAKLLRKVIKSIKGAKVYQNPKVAKVTVIGDALRVHHSTASRIFAAMAREHINMLSITTSQLKISFLVDEKYAELAVRALHTEFGLGA